MAISTGLSDYWMQWLAACLINGVTEDDIQQTLLQQGADRASVARAVEECREHPFFKAGLNVFHERRKLEWLLRVYHHSYNQSRYANGIEYRDHLSQEEFLERYYCANRPVILTDIANNWPITTRWTPEYLQQQFGHLEVEIQHYVTRESQVEHIKDMMPFSRFLEQIQQPDCPTDLYMTAYNAKNNQSFLQALFREVGPLPVYLDPDRLHESLYLWLGPKGTMGRFHMDLANSFLTQIRGRKQLRLAPSFSLPYVYHESGGMVSSIVDLDRVSDPSWQEQFPMFQHVPLIEVTLQPGEMLFIPIGWWHQVKALDLSISLTFTNFNADNTYFTTPEVNSLE